MTISIAPPIKLQFFDKTVTPMVPLSGGKLYTYEAGTSTPKAAYTDSTGDTAHANPIILDSNGEASVWFNGLYKINLTNSAGTQVSGYPIDNVSSSPAVSTAFSEWLTLAHTWTYIGATSFSVPGDETATYQVGRRVKCTVTAGTVYGIITASSYASSITTVTVVNDSGSLDSGLSDVKVGVITVSYHSLAPLGVDDLSLTDAKMQETTDPYPASATAKATTLDGEMKQLRYQISQMLGGAVYWYQDAVASLYSLFYGTNARVSKGTSYTATATDYSILFDCTSGALSLTLPTAVGIAGKRYRAKKSDATANTLTLQCAGAETIDGITTYVISLQHDYATVESDGANWRIVGGGAMYDFTHAVHTHANTAGGGQIGATGITGALGTWTTGTKNSSTLAATDLLIVVDCDWSSASANGYVICKTDAANPPTNIKSVATCSNAGVSRNSCFLPVKKGHYYLVSETVTGGTPVISLYVIPLGS